LTAVLATLGVFHKMHILTLVFGTSLIGSCIDYSIHYFTHWAGNSKLKDGREIRAELLPGLSLAILSTSLCYIILLFAPFNLLKQMALFSLVGLISSYLTTICIYPYIPMPKGERKIYFNKWFKPAKNPKRKQMIGRIVITALFVVSILSIVICRKNLRIHNDLNNLYAMEGDLLADEIEANTIIQYNPTGWFIIAGDTAEQALENEEFVRNEIAKVSKEKVGYLCTSLFIPSIEKQKASRAACENLLALADFQYEALGYDPSDAVQLRADFKNSSNDFVSFENGNIPEFILESISSCWLGEVDGKYYSVLLPNKITDAAAFEKISENNENVFFINKMADMGKDLDKLTIMVLKFFAIAYVIMYIVLRLFYKRKNALKIISVPLLIVLVAAAVFAIFKINLEFFSVTGLILVFGLGLDYIIYMMENEKERTVERDKTLEPLAIMLSFITTIISFGALALSSFVPVHLIGLVIFLGLATAYVSTFFYDRSY
jgi:predicted exporter